LRTNFEAANGNPPTQEEVQELVAWALDRDMLLQTAIDRDFHLTDSVIRERLIRNMRFLGLDDGRTSDEMFEAALNMSLHLEDTACKRRLVQRMKQTLLAGNPIEDPTEQEIQAEFERRRAELTRPVVGFLHFYFPYDQAEEVDKVKEVIAGKQISPTQAKRLGSVFSMGHHFTRLKPEQLDLFFGRQFADELLGSDPQPGSWYGPLRSTHGLHLIWLDTIDESTVQTADDVRELLERDLKVQLRGEALNAALEQLRQNYEVRS
jgi:hypothetical protein